MKELQLYRGAPLRDDALYYVMDPMCSWCWAYQPVLRNLIDSDRLTTSLIYVMGGLAPDSEQPMPDGMRTQIEAIWHQIEQRTGVAFNYDFWRLNTPRRSTYPACRAVLAAEALQPGSFTQMVEGIQRAYYTQARNPSDLDTLSSIAAAQDIDAATFATLIQSEPLAELLFRHLRLRDQLLVQGYPSLVWWHQQQAVPVTYGYCDLDSTLERLRQVGYWHHGRR